MSLHIYKIQVKNIFIKILTVHTRHKANGNGNRNPDNMLKKMDPGIANDCKLKTQLSKINTIVCCCYIEKTVQTWRHSKFNSPTGLANYGDKQVDLEIAILKWPACTVCKWKETVMIYRVVTYVDTNRKHHCLCQKVSYALLKYDSP